MIRFTAGLLAGVPVGMVLLVFFLGAKKTHGETR